MTARVIIVGIMVCILFVFGQTVLGDATRWQSRGCDHAIQKALVLGSPSPTEYCLKHQEPELPCPDASEPLARCE